MLRENAHIPDAFGDVIHAVRFGEEPAQAFGRDVFLDILGIDSGSSLLDAGLAHVRPENLNADFRGFISQEFEERMAIE